MASLPAVLRLLVPGTRSFWFADGEKNWRVDLPPVELLAFRNGLEPGEHDPDATGDAECSWTIGNALPGFSIWVERQDRSDAQPRPAVRLTTERRETGFVRGVRGQAGGCEIGLVFPGGREEGLETRYCFTVVNPDGSRSRTVSLSRRGSIFVGAVETAAPPLPAPIDEPTQVPRVALHAVSQAIESAEAVGLVPIVVDLHGGRALGTGQFDSNAIVLRQGRPAGEIVHRGAALFLSLARPDNVTVATDSLAARAARRGTMDVGESNGFLEIARSSRPDQIIAGLGGMGLSSPAQANDAGSGDDTTQMTSAGLAQGPGLHVDLRPQRTNDDARVRPRLAEILRAGVRDDGSNTFAGPLGDYLSAGARLVENAMAPVVSRGEPLGEDVATRLLDLAGERMGAQVPDQERAEISAAWREGATRRIESALLGPRQLDRVATDVAGLLLVELDERHHLDLASSIDGGNLPAKQSVPEKPSASSGRSTARSRGLGQRPAQVHSVATSISATGPPNTRLSAGGAASDVPGTVIEVSSPTKIRMPILKGKTVSSAKGELVELGLSLRPEGMLLPDDVITSTEPAPRTWLAPGTGITLIIERRVPNVVGLSLQEAEARLASAELRALADSSIGGNVVVRFQHPVHNTLVHRHDVINLATRRPAGASEKMPELLDLTMAEAKKRVGPLGISLTEHQPRTGAYPTRPTAHRTRVGDLVIERQSVPAGHDVERGAAVTVTLARVVVATESIEVPNFSGDTLEQAEQLAHRYGLTVFVRAGTAPRIESGA